MKTNPRFIHRGLALALVFWPAAVSGQGIIEDFATPLNATDGATLGSDGQLTVRLSGGGAFTVGGGQGVLFAPSVAGSALISSTEPLPHGPYTLRVSLNAVYLPGVPPGENAAVILGLYDWSPRPATSTVWVGHGVLEVVALERFNEVTGRHDHLFAIFYWDDTLSGLAFDGNAWVPFMDTYAAKYTPGNAYDVRLERTATDYVITISSGGTLVTSAAIPLSQARSVADAWVSCGFPHTDQELGALALGAVEMPPASAYHPDGGQGPLDAGADLELDSGSDTTSDDAGRDASPEPDAAGGDAGPGDGGQRQDAGTAKLDAPSKPGSDGGGSTSVMAAGCECSLRGTGSDSGGRLAALTLLALWFARRRRRC